MSLRDDAHVVGPQITPLGMAVELVDWMPTVDDASGTVQCFAHALERRGQGLNAMVFSWSDVLSQPEWTEQMKRVEVLRRRNQHCIDTFVVSNLRETDRTFGSRGCLP